MTEEEVTSKAQVATTKSEVATTKSEAATVKAEEVTQKAETTLHRTNLVVGLSFFLLIVILVIVVVLEIQVQTRNADIHKVKGIVTQAAASTAASEKAINDAISQTSRSSTANRQFVQEIQDGLAAIKRIEQKLEEM